MRVLCLNTGSSSFKWSMLGMPGEDLLASGEEPLAPGSASPDLAVLRQTAGAPDAIAHRLVHGGGRFRGATRIDDGVLETLRALRSIDPTHTPRALAGIAAAQLAFPGVSQVACFDTTFHATLAAAAYTYAIPDGWSTDWGLRRFGFHGLSVAYAVRRAAEVLGRAPGNLLVCHLGSGSSITAVSGGRSVDTTMGFTPLEGLPMATRSGSVDPGLLLYVMREHGLGAAEIERVLENESGLWGLAGTGDLREVLRRSDAGESAAERAYAVWLTGVRRGFGAMLAALTSLEAVVFTGGIGEHSSRVRRDVLLPFGWCGVALEDSRNLAAAGDTVVSSSTSKIAVLALQAREDLTMAREAAALPT